MPAEKRMSFAFILLSLKLWLYEFSLKLPYLKEYRIALTAEIHIKLLEICVNLKFTIFSFIHFLLKAILARYLGIGIFFIFIFY